MRYLLIVLVLFCSVGCEDRPVRKEIRSRVMVISKQKAEENRFSGGDFFFGNGSVTKTQSVFYIQTPTGLYEVPLEDYMRAVEGQSLMMGAEWKKRQ